jgi:demethylmenaquinone methyltransferase/2-methoxy-6-polyprenyl-1,4-benzoquinol methylase
MMTDQRFDGREHLLVGGDESFGRSRVVAGRERRISDEADEGIDRGRGDVLDGGVSGSGEREQLRKRQTRIEEREPRSHRCRVRVRVAGDAVRVDVVGEEQSCAGHGLKQGRARTDRFGEPGEVVVGVGVVGRCGHRRRERGVGRGERGAVRLHVGKGRRPAVGSLPAMPAPDDAQADPPLDLPAASRDGKDAALVQAMFDRVAPRYDLANTVLSLGQDGHWRRVTAAAAQPEGGQVLDVAAGPGNVAVELIRQGAAGVTALDLSFNMLWEGARQGHVGISWVNGDALALPFSDATFDAVTISFGLRNVPDPEAALAEFARVTRPGGRVVVCEFADPTRGPFREVYRRYLVGALPQVARVVSSNAPAYQYLADSILAWPDRRTLAGWMDAAGFDEVRVRDLSGGIVAVHRGVRR